MSLVVEKNYANGVPQTTLRGFAPTGAAWHWTAGGSGRAGWEGSLRHLIGTRFKVNASYHGGLWHEHAADGACRTVIQWVVPVSRAAHSIAPSQVLVFNANKNRALQEARFAEVRRILGAKARDPNAACIAIAYAGMPLGLQKDLACSVFRADVQELARAVIAETSAIERPHFGHGWIQPISRYEMDVAADFIGLLYEAPSSPQEEENVPTDFSGAHHEEPKVVRIRQGAVIYEHESGETLEDIQGTVKEEFDAYFTGLTVNARHLCRRLDRQGGAWWVKQEALVPEDEVPFRRYVLEAADCEQLVAEAETHTRDATNQEWRAWLATAPAAPE